MSQVQPDSEDDALENELAEVPDLRRTAEDLLDELRTAETCDCKNDLVANLSDALHSARALVNDLVSALKRAKAIK